jgi:FkbM family methyltransferase
MILDFKELHKKYKMNVTGIIHIGANTGEEYELYKNYSEIKNIVFFEPDKDVFKILQATVKDDKKVKCINMALGPIEAKMLLYKANNTQSSSLLKPALHLSQYRQILFTSTETVSVTTLDKYCFDNSYNLMNIDVQGYELEVLRGAKKTLNNIQYIITEVNNVELYENGCIINQLDDFLSSYNFKRVETDWAGGTWGDAFYIK